MLKLTKEPMSRLIKILEESVVEGLCLKLPPRQLDRQEYLEVKKYLNGIGGAWKGGRTQGFVFKHDPMPHIDKLLGTGQVVNLKKDFQFFATPASLADRLVTLAMVNPWDRILEPSAGDGAIIRAIHRSNLYAPVDYCELMPENQQILRQLSGHPYPDDEFPAIHQVGDDFLTYENPQAYDCIIANPPFAKKQDIRHVRKMFDMLKPKGRMVAITGTGWRTNEDLTTTEFRNWLYTTKHEIELIPAGTFKESGTNIPTLILSIRK